MRIALLADIHANREALEACLAHARGQGAAKFVLLGDYVGYGADPVWVMNTVMDLVAGGAAAVAGNHDRAVSDATEAMNVNAEIAIAWTRGQLGPAARDFLARLPERVEDEDRLYFHADRSSARRWLYVTGPDDALQCFTHSAARVTFCGHVHIPGVFAVTATGKITHLRPSHGAAVPLLRQRRWLAVLGSVGQPRDNDPGACYAMLDTGSAEITYFRVPYDVELAGEKIRKAGLPEALAARLLVGR